MTEDCADTIAAHIVAPGHRAVPARYGLAGLRSEVRVEVVVRVKACRERVHPENCRFRTARVRSYGFRSLAVSFECQFDLCLDPLLSSIGGDCVSNAARHWFLSANIHSIDLELSLLFVESIKIVRQPRANSSLMY